MTHKHQKAFGIIRTGHGKDMLICGEDSFYYVSYDGFKLEQKMSELRGMFPKNKYKIVDLEMFYFNDKNAKAKGKGGI